MAAITATNLEIARLANAHARADVATWQMMAKLRSTDALPADAQIFYAGYLRLMERPNTTVEDATEATIQTVYASYYAKMGGTGSPPRSRPATKMTARNDPMTDNVTPFRRIKPASPSAPKKNPLPVALIFLALIAVAVGWHYAKTGF